MVERINLRLSPKKKKKMETDAKVKDHDSLNSYINAAIDHYLQCDKVKPSRTMRLVRLPPDAECSICHKIPEYPWGYEWEGEYHCLDCDAKKYGSKGTAKLALEERKRKYVLKVLKGEVERMLDVYEEVDYVSSVSEVLEANKKVNQRIMELADLFYSFINEVVGKVGEKEEREGFEKLMSALEDYGKQRDDARTVLNKALEILNKLLMTRKKRKKKTEPIVA